MNRAAKAAGAMNSIANRGATNHRAPRCGPTRSRRAMRLRDAKSRGASRSARGRVPSEPRRNEGERGDRPGRSRRGGRRRRGGGGGNREGGERAGQVQSQGQGMSPAQGQDRGPETAGESPRESNSPPENSDQGNGPAMSWTQPARQNAGQAQLFEPPAPPARPAAAPGAGAAGSAPRPQPAAPPPAQHR